MVSMLFVYLHNWCNNAVVFDDDVFDDNDDDDDDKHDDDDDRDCADLISTKKTQKIL